ncbi:hypothetical protein D915_009994 [Fasciola hepatica]|uniref:Uncharacterized protein n=1 Tax=Fasciola hepatica TaxID=6192 RepID=A0A4E0RCE6_FASHE|nr:hypothetical protein D915_009994 [Fasciola hepatica]
MGGTLTHVRTTRDPTATRVWISPGNVATPGGREEDSARALTLGQSKDFYRDVPRGGGQREACTPPATQFTPKVREKQIRQELELQSKEQEIRRSRENVGVQNVVELAKLWLDTKQHFEEQDAVSSDRIIRVEKYVEACCTRNTLEVAVAELITDEPEELHRRTAQAFYTPDLQKAELTSFDGDPKEYWMFTRQFETHFESMVKQKDQRLLYLIHCCRGRVNQAILDCVTLPPALGYPGVPNILRDLFGQSHRVAASLLDSLFNPARGTYNQAETLSDPAIRIEDCSIAPTQVNYSSYLNSMNKLEMFARSLAKQLKHR